jgi:predicted ATPase/DNA-binding SARP family transcriptional activator/Tfp pilus assembly protein PilF
MEFRLLGAFEVEDGGRVLGLGGSKPRALLASLLLRANSVVARDVLIEELWGGEPPASAAHSLEVYVSRLRRVLPGRLETRDGGYLLRADPVEVDATRLEELLDAARRARAAGDAARAVERVDAALALWRGPALSGLELVGGLAAEAARLEELRLLCLEERAESALAAGRHAEILPGLESLARRHPLRERIRGQLMLALYRCGRQADALAEYRRARRELDELGIEPGVALRELERAILCQEPGIGVAVVPRPAGAFIGREREVQAVLELLDGGARLVTLVGPGGVGKTRLALEAAAHRADAVVVSLGGLEDPALVPTSITSALGEGETLVVLDEVEGVLAAASAVAELLARTPRLRVLATSRVPLRVAGEHEFHVAPLMTRDAVALLRWQARALGFDPGGDDVLGEICQRLDGLPLAIELAAARLRVLSARALLERLDRRLDVLVGGRRDAPERQHTLRATIAWSYELLDPGEQRVFAALGVFAGGCTIEMAEAVCDAALGELESLVEQSVLRRAGDRIVMLETVREFALERLADRADADSVRLRHALVLLGLAETADEALSGGRPDAWLARLEEEHANLRAAERYLAATEREDEAARLAVALSEFWLARGHEAEGLRAVERVLARPGPIDASLRARTLALAARLAIEVGDVGRARSHAKAALAIDGETAAQALIVLGLAASMEGDRARARELLEAARSRAATRYVEADALDFLGELDLGDGRLAEAQERFERSLSLRSAADTGWGLSNLALIAHARGDHAEARDLLARALALAHEYGSATLAAECLVGLAATLVAQGDPRAAARMLGVAEGLLGRSGYSSWLAEAELRDEALAGVRSALEQRTLDELLAEGRATSLADAIAVEGAATGC